MKKYTIDGKLKTESKHCPACLDGKRFEKDIHIKTDSKANDYTQRICGECFTKYHIPYVLSNLEIDTPRGIRLTPARIERFSETSLTKSNEHLHIVKIALDFDNKVKDMEQTECNGQHQWIESYPFKTAEGVYSVKSCLNCKESTITHNGTTYGGTIMELVTFVADMGVAYEKESLAVLSKNVFDDLEIATTVAQTATFNPFDTLEVAAQTDTTPVIDWGI